MKKLSSQIIVTTLLLAGCGVEEEPQEKLVVASAAPKCDTAALQLFNKRILPILRSDNPSSCAECHAGGVDLKEYITPDQKTTFLNLAASGLVDTANPEKSKILEIILKAPETTTLMNKGIRQREYSAFKAWLDLAGNDSCLVQTTTPTDGQVEKNTRPQTALLTKFSETIWPERERCLACHGGTANEIVGPVLFSAEDMSATLNLMINTPRLIDRTDTENSLLLLKPTEQISHTGGQKFVVGDATYVNWLSFLDTLVASEQ